MNRKFLKPGLKAGWIFLMAMTLAFSGSACKKRDQGMTQESSSTSPQATLEKHDDLVKGQKVKIEIETSLGKIVAELDADKAPVTVKNFVDYATSGFYDGTIFHRVIDGFMIQGGGFQSGMKEKTTKAPIQNEASNGLKNEIFTLAMARTNDPNSATAQFFINLNDNAFLNKAPGNDGYAVFGKVVEGSDVVQKIGKVKTGSKGYFDDVPLEEVSIKSVKVL